ncbi:MAG TPA: HlyD family secretion protein [Candidatus Binataceae bacterium]|nr:HlyD family secretion protein [Candidatus Binataceae bacterium]
MNRNFLRRLVVIALVPVIVTAGALFGWPYYRYLASHVSTDDAYVDGTSATIAARVAGTVVAVGVKSNWSVKRGQVLARLDPRDYQVALEQAQAQLERARQSVDSLYAGYQSAQSALALTQAELRQAKLDYDRAKSLRVLGVIAQEKLDQAATAYRSAQAERGLAEHALEQARASLGASAEDHDRYDRPIVHQAQAALDAARLQLSYTVIRAPLDGIVTNKHIALGDRVQAGEPLMTLVPPPARLYVTANFKETQLRDVRVGQPVTMSADAYPGYVYRAHVDSIGMGTGSAFALLPPENATGNWVKVVQRVPVKIVLDGPPPARMPLRIGLSMDVSIDVSDRHGSVLASQGQEDQGVLAARDPQRNQDSTALAR